MDYLKSIDMHALLQEVVRDALEHKPADALAFLAEWAKTKLELRAAANAPSASTAASSPRPEPLPSSSEDSADRVLSSQSIDVTSTHGSEFDLRDPGSVVAYTWRQRSAAEPGTFARDFSRLVLNVLLTQHPSMRRFFVEDAGLGVDAAALKLEALLRQVASRTLSAYEAAKAILLDARAWAAAHPQHGTLVLRLRERHFHYALCAMLGVAKMVLSERTWRTVGDAWLRCLGEFVQEVEDAICGEQLLVAARSAHDALDSDFERRVLVTTTSLVRKSSVDVVKGIWLALAPLQQERVCRKFFAVLITQHRSLARWFVSDDADCEDAIVELAPVAELQAILTQVLRGFLSLEAIAKMAQQRVAGRSDHVEHRHLQHALSCMLTALKLELGVRMDAKICEAWRDVLTRVLDAVASGIAAPGAAAAAATAAMPAVPTAGASAAASSSVEPGKATLKAQLSPLWGISAEAQKRIVEQVDSGLKVHIDDPPKLEKNEGASAFSVAAECWAAALQTLTSAELADQYLGILFTQHRTLQKSVLRGQDEYSQLLAHVPALFEEVVSCRVSASDLRDIGAHLTGRGLDEQKAEHCIAAAMSLFAITLGIAVFREREEALREVCAFITDNILFGVQHSAAVLSGRAPAVIVNESWSGIVDKAAVARSVVDIMRIQHRSLTRDMLNGIELESFLPRAGSFITRALAGDMPDAEVAAAVDALRAQLGPERPLEAKVVTYLVNSLHAAVAIALGHRFEQISAKWTAHIEALAKRFAAHV
jgi:hypothetical protein